jgi:hypothetical protein
MSTEPTRGAALTTPFVTSAILALEVVHTTGAVVLRVTACRVIEALRLRIKLVIAVPPAVFEISNEGGAVVVTVKGIDAIKNPSLVVTDIDVEPAVIPLTKPFVTVATAGLEEDHHTFGAEDVS